MSHIVAIQSTYQTVELGLFDGTQCLGESILDKKESSAQLMPSLAALCNAHQWDIKTISYLVTNQGPGPFTTLRTVIASVNGLGFATGISIIGINALEALILEGDPDNTHTTLALLNAFGGELYYGLRYAGESDIITGVDLLANIYGKIQADSLQVVGAAAAASASLLQDIYKDNVIIHTHLSHASLKTVTTAALKQIHAGYTGARQIMPNYLKNSM